MPVTVFLRQYLLCAFCSLRKVSRRFFEVLWRFDARCDKISFSSAYIIYSEVVSKCGHGERFDLEKPCNVLSCLGVLLCETEYLIANSLLAIQ